MSTRSWLGIAVTTVVLYLWGFAYWGASPLPYMAWSETKDDRAAGQALLEHFPESGTYFVPGNGNPPELRAELYESGPTGFVIIDRDGRPEFDPGIMMRGFLLNGVVVVLLALLFRMCGGALSSHGDRLKLSVLVGAIAVLLIDGGRIVWWVIPADWVLAQGVYDFSVFVIAGAVLTRFMDTKGDADA